MTLWIIRQTVSPSEATSELRLPFEGLPDLSGVRSEAEMRGLLQTLSPAAPPETILRQAEVYWRNKSEMNMHDLVLVPLADGVGYALGEITSPYAYRTENGQDIHYASVGWLRLRVPKRNVTMVKDEGLAMQQIESADARKQIFALTPNSTNRFYQWRWILGVLLIMQAVVMLVSMLRLPER